MLLDVDLIELWDCVVLNYLFGWIEICYCGNLIVFIEYFVVVVREVSGLGDGEFVVCVFGYFVFG